jgi:membrane protein
VRRMLVSTTMALVALVLFVGATVLFLLGPQLAATLAGGFGLEDFTRSMLTVLRWPLLVILLLVVYALVYWSAPAVDAPFRMLSYGAIAALVLWLAFTFLFSLYSTRSAPTTRPSAPSPGVVVLCSTCSSPHSFCSSVPRSTTFCIDTATRGGCESTTAT